MDGRPIVLVEAARARHPTSAWISAKSDVFFSAARVSHSHKMIQNDHWLGNRKYWESNDIEKEMMEIWIWGSIFWTSPWLATPKQSQTPSHMKFLVLTVDRESNGKSPLFFTAEISNWVVHCILLHLPRKDAKEISCTCAYIYIYWYVYTCDFEKKTDIIFKYMISKKKIIFKYKYIYIYTYIWYSMIYMYIHLDAICFNIDELYVMISIKRG